MAYRFFLGGRDLEMVEIRRLLDRHAAGRIEDKRLAWGAALSAYREELLAALARGETPVMIELADDLLADLFDRARVIVVDHHGPLAGHDRPTSIEQVFALLGLPAAAWTRRLALVAANDRAHVAGMRALGATPDEIAEIRAADRAAQGVSAPHPGPLPASGERGRKFLCNSPAIPLLGRVAELTGKPSIWKARRMARLALIPRRSGISPAFSLRAGESGCRAGSAVTASPRFRVPGNACAALGRQPWPDWHRSG